MGLQRQSKRNCSSRAYVMGSTFSAKVNWKVHVMLCWVTIISLPLIKLVDCLVYFGQFNVSHSKFSLSFDINNDNHPWSTCIYVRPHVPFPFSDWDPKLHRLLAIFLTSSSFAEMGNSVCWCNSETDYRVVRLGQSCREIRPVKSSSTSGLSKLRWKVLWLKFTKEMKRMFECVSPLQVPYYNPYTYSQNFDQGFAWEEPDNLSRSFSVRFADPSRRLLKKTEM